jgi:hypothetical protein
MKIPILATAAGLLLSAAASGQHTQLNDDGTLSVIGLNSGYVHNAAAGSLCTDFNSNNQFAGNMIDIAPAVDMEITGVDMNLASVGNTAEIEVWYIPGTSVGNESSSAGWTSLGTFTGTSAGTDLPSFFDMSGNGMTFVGGQTYGLYFDCISYGNGDTVRYTNGSGAGGGPNGEDQWSNADLMITANAGKGTGGHGGSTFSPRNWNGCIHYDTGSGGGFTLSSTGLTAGATTTVSTTGGTPGTLVYVCYSLTGGGPTATPYGMADLSKPIRALKTQTADAAGETSLDRGIPAGWAGQMVYMQALNVTGPGAGVFSNQLVDTIL